MRLKVIICIGAGFLILVAILFFSGRTSFPPLERAIAFGDTDRVAEILKSKPALANKPFGPMGDTPLLRAVSCRNPKETIDLLIAGGADINARSGGFNLTPLHQAVWSARVDAIKTLLAHKPDVNALNSEGRAPLHYAISVYMGAVFAGSTNNIGKDIIELLLANGADINAGYPILLDASHYAKNAGLVEFLLSKGANVSVQEADKGETALNLAIVSGNKAAVEMILRHSPNLRQAGGNDGTALGTAIENRRFDMALMILTNALEKHSNTLSFAAAQGDLNELQALLEKNPQSLNEKDELGFTPLAWAAARGQTAAGSILISRGAEINSADRAELNPLAWAVCGGSLPLIGLLVTNRAANLDTALVLAIEQQQIPAVKFLLEHGASPNAQHRLSEALHVAAELGNIESARLLLEHGAQINVAERGESALERAVLGDSTEMVEFLFAHGASIPHRSPDFLSIFHEWAIGTGNTNIANVLLSHKADMHAKNRDGQTPLHLAALQGELQAVAWLLQHGADVNARDNRGTTPLGIVLGRGGRTTRREVADLLQKYGAKR